MGLKHGRVAFDAAPDALDRATLDSLYDRASDTASARTEDHDASIAETRATAAA